MPPENDHGRSEPTGTSSPRRRFLQLTGALGATALAGCSGGDGGDGGGSDGGGSDGGGGSTQTEDTSLDDLSPSEWRKEMAERAKEEVSDGEQIQWVTAIRSAEIVEEWQSAWDEEYPELEGKVNAIQGRTTDMRNRMLREVEAGEASVDITDANMASVIEKMPFTSLSGIPSYDALADGVKLESNIMGAYGYLPYFPSYNTELIDEGGMDLYQSYDDILEMEAWHDDRIVIDFTPNPAKVVHVLKNAGEDWVREFGETVMPRMIESGAKITQVVADGSIESALMSIGPHVPRHAGNGKPIEPIFAQPLWIWSVKKIFIPFEDGNQPHTAGAKLMADFLSWEKNADLQAFRTGQIAVDGETAQPEVEDWVDMFTGPDSVPNPITGAEDLGLEFGELDSRYQELVGAPTV